MLTSLGLFLWTDLVGSIYPVRMAWVEQRQDGRIFIGWRDDSGKKHRKKVADPAQAERILGSLQSRRESRKDSAGFWDAKGGP